MMTHGARLLVIFSTGFPSAAHWTAFKTCDGKGETSDTDLVVINIFMSGLL